MNKKFLKSVAFLGLASTALGMAQPVGAVVGGRNEDAVAEIRNVINQVDKTTPKIKDSEYFNHLLKHSHNKVSAELNTLILMSKDPFYSDEIYSEKATLF